MSSSPVPPSSSDERSTRTGRDGAPPTGSDAPVAEPDCSDAVAELYAFLDGELDESTVVQVEAHLRRCSPCLEAFDFESDLRRVIAARSAEEMPPALRERFCGMLRDLARGDDPVGSGVPSGPDGS